MASQYPAPVPAQYIGPDQCTVGPDRAPEFLPGVRVWADCGPAGAVLATVRTCAVDPARALLTLDCDADGLTAGLVGLLHSNDNPLSLCNHAAQHAAGGRDPLDIASLGLASAEEVAEAITSAATATTKAAEATTSAQAAGQAADDALAAATKAAAAKAASETARDEAAAARNLTLAGRDAAVDAAEVATLRATAADASAAAARQSELNAAQSAAAAGNIPQATTDTAGKLKTATPVLTQAGTDTTTAVTPASGAASYAPIGKGVTNGDAHDHSGGDGGQIAYASLSGLPTIPAASSTAPAALGTAAAGSGATFARADHVHAMPTAASVGAMATTHAANAITGFGTPATTVSGSSSASAGSATTVARSDHNHNLGAHTHADAASGGTIAYSALTGLPTIPTASSTVPAALGTAAVGAGTTYARSDHVHAMPTAANVGALASGADINLADYKVQRPYLQDWAEVVNARGSISGAQTIDLELGNVVTATISAATTFTFSNPPASGRAGCFVLALTNGGAYTITWPTSVKWPSSTAPTLTASGVDMVSFHTIDGGTTWRGALCGKGYAA